MSACVKFINSANLLAVSKTVSMHKHYFFMMASEDGPSQQLSANDPNFGVVVLEWFHEEDLSDADVQLHCNEPILISDHDTNSELSETYDSEGYIVESSPDEDN
jgi:hypothetical protein